MVHKPIVVLVSTLLLCSSKLVDSEKHTSASKDHNYLDLIQARRYETLVSYDLMLPMSQEENPSPPQLNLRKRKVAVSCDRTTLPVDPLPGKRGLGTPLNPEKKSESLRKLHALKPSWNLSWNSYLVDEQLEDMEFVPMLWGAGGGEEGLRNRIENDILPGYQQGHIKRVILFQSPDRANQANLSVDTVVGFWDMLSSYGIPLTSPTSSNFLGNWMQQFFRSVDSQCLRLEHVAIQWYGPPDVKTFQAEMQRTWNIYGNRPLLITELAVTDSKATTTRENRWSQEEVLEFAKTVLPWLESQDWIVGYAWIPYDTNSVIGTSAALLYPDGSLTPLGEYYRSITPDTPMGDNTIQVPMSHATISDSLAISAAASASSEPSGVPSPSPTKCNEPLSVPPLPGKKGIGLVLSRPDSLQRNLNRIRSLDLSWNYSWNSELIAEQPDGVEFLPMIWGAWGEAGVRRRIEKDILPQYKQGKIHRFLAFNEPDMKLQSDLSVEKVLGYWPVLEEAGIPLASPSVGHAFGTWMQGFMQQIESNCFRVEYTAIHWYKNPNPDKFKQDMIDAYYHYGQRPILLTEFAPADWDATNPDENRHSKEAVLSFAKEVLPWMERQPFIAGYAWFPFKSSFAPGSTSSLFEGDNSETLTTLGRYYKRYVGARETWIAY